MSAYFNPGARFPRKNHNFDFMQVVLNGEKVHIKERICSLIADESGLAHGSTPHVARDVSPGSRISTPGAHRAGIGGQQV